MPGWESACVDSRGAVDLSTVDVPVVAVHTPAAAGSRRMNALASMPTGARDALRWLFAASVLQALVVHVRSERGARFDLDTRDLYAVTVAQLSALVKDHHGSAGQGFELAVCDALNAGVPDVCDEVVEALSGIGVQMSAPRAIVMGLEKVTDPMALAAAVASAVGDRRLLTGQRGRPGSAARAVEALLAVGTQITSSRGALAAADLLVYDADGDYTVTASVKISPTGWSAPRESNVPRLWITSGRRSLVRARLAPGCAVACIGDSTLQLFRTAHGDVVAALRGVDVGRMAPDGRTPIYQVLRRGRNQPVAAALDELRERAAMVFDGYGLVLPVISEPERDVVSVEALDVPAEFDRFAESETASGLRVLQARRLTDLVLPHEQFFRARAA